MEGAHPFQNNLASGRSVRFIYRAKYPRRRQPVILGFSMTRRAVGFGASGQLGVELVRELRSRGYEVAGWDRVHADITDPADVERSLAGFDAQAVFNCAAYNQVDVAEKEPQAAFLVNALA